MKRLFILLALLICSTAQAAAPDWWMGQVPGGDFGAKGISYTQPNITTGKAWFFTNGNVVPCGENGGWPGDHTAYVSTYDPDLWPSDTTVALHAPAPGIQVAYWCSGEERPAPTNSHWVLLPTWPSGITDQRAYGVDFPIYQQNTCKIAVYNGDGYPSAIISNIHTRHADDTTCAAKDRNQGHWSYRFMFTLVDLDALATPTTPTTAPTFTSVPTRTPTTMPTWTPAGTPTIESIRNACWNRVYPIGGIPYNPNAGFPRIARERELGVPVTTEFDVGNVRIQGFAGGILYATIGNWGDVKWIEW